MRVSPGSLTLIYYREPAQGAPSFLFIVKKLNSIKYSKNNENVTFITIFFVKVVTYEKLTKI
jgi:hypothetical protein